MWVMSRPGRIVYLRFQGARSTKLRPAVVVSSDEYHDHRPDIIVAICTTQINDATAPTDYVLQDWSDAGLSQVTAVRMFLNTYPRTCVVRELGELSERDWQEVQ